MEYKSTTQIAKRLSLPYREVAVRNVQKILQKLDLLDRYYTPTAKASAFHLYKTVTFRGKEIIKWNEDVEIEIANIFFEDKTF